MSETFFKSYFHGLNLLYNKYGKIPRHQYKEHFDTHQQLPYANLKCGSMKTDEIDPFSSLPPDVLTIASSF